MSQTIYTSVELHAMIEALDVRCRTQRTALPHDAPPPDSWAAVLFLVHQQRFLTPLEQIAEVLEVPTQITRVPGTKPWFLGVANNRGMLLPISDLTVLLQGGSRRKQAIKRGERRARERVLVIRQQELACGLVVSETMGMRHVRHNERSARVPELPAAAQPYVDTGFMIDDEVAPVLRVERLLADPLFNAAMN